MGFLDRLLGRKAKPHSRMGVGPYGWQPPRIVQPTYELREEDRVLWESFELAAAAAAALEFESLATFTPLKDEPSAVRLKDLDDEVWWSRSNGQLLILVERLWAGFPDPLAFSLLAWDASQSRLIDLGQFWTFPEVWKRT